MTMYIVIAHNKDEPIVRRANIKRFTSKKESTEYAKTLEQTYDYVETLRIVDDFVTVSTNTGSALEVNMFDRVIESQEKK